MRAMSRICQRWPVLLSALVSLLIPALCNAAPMSNGASGSGNAASTSSVPGNSYSDFTNAHANAENVWLQNQVHYKSYPVFNSLTQPPELIEAARDRLGGAWLVRPTQDGTELTLSKQGGESRRVSARQGADILKKLQEASELESQNGPQARSIKFGRPFNVMFTRTPTWSKVWDGRNTFHPFLPLSQESNTWPIIREKLQTRRHLVLVDTLGGRELGFRLNLFGKVEMKIRDLATRIHKRSKPSSYSISLEEAHEDNQYIHKQPKKRTVDSFYSYESIPRLNTMEYILAHPEGLIIDPGLPPTSAGELDRKYAHILHFSGVPVYDVHTTDVHDLEQALVDYDHVYVYGRMQGSREKSVIQVFAHKAPVVTPPGSDILLKKVALSRNFEAVWGPQIRALVDGRPIQRIQGGSRDQNIFFAGRGHDDLNLYQMRDALAKSGSLSIHHLDSGNGLELTLDMSDLPELVSGLDPAELGHPRVIKRADTIGYYEHGSAAYPKLSKRMYSGSSSQMKPFEYYVGPRFQVGQQNILTPQQMDANFADEIHFDGTPILFPPQAPESKVRKAIHSYGKTWIVGRPSNLPADHPLQYVRLQDNKEPGVLNSHGWDQVSLHLVNANNFESNYGRIPKYLKYGRPFSLRKESFFSRYKVPSWDKVKRKGTVFHLPGAKLPHVRAHLDANNYLNVFDRERGKLYGFALDKTGTVLFHDFGKYHL